jgi:endonuclease YncB( thermonuclease family)
MPPRVWSRSRRFSPRALTVSLLLVAASIALSVGWFDRAPALLTGHARTVDGDTLRLGNERIRLTRLDAPELDQICTDAAGGEWPCGEEARAFLAALVQHNEVRCLSSGRDVYRRALAACTIGDRDIGAQIVAAGWATGDFGYGDEEGVARAGQRGIWSGSFVAPVEWRRTHGKASVWDWIRSWFQ